MLNLNRDKAIVLATDGVWDVMSNEDVARIVWLSYQKGDVDEAAKSVTKMAEGRWKNLMKKGYNMDDITCIVVFLGQEKKGQEIQVEEISD